MKILTQHEKLLFEHKGISVYMFLDYEQKTVSFIEQDGSPKKWTFANRTREYLGGWWLILEALQAAIKYADERLEDEEKASKSANQSKVIDLMLALSDIRDGNNDVGGKDE